MSALTGGNVRLKVVLVILAALVCLGMGATFASADTAVHITGAVTDAGTGEALAGVLVTAHLQQGSDWTWAGEAYTDLYGRYDIGGMTAGTYAVEFADPESAYAPQFYSDQDELDAADTLTLADGEAAFDIDAALSLAQPSDDAAPESTTTLAGLSKPIPSGPPALAEGQQPLGGSLQSGDWTESGPLAVYAPDAGDGLLSLSNTGGLSLTETGSDTVLFYDDMESGTGSWTADAPWAITEEWDSSPTHSWSDSPGGDYANDLYDGASLMSPIIDLSAQGAETVVLAFNCKFALEDGWDYLFVECSNDGGVTWSDVDNLNGDVSGAYYSVALPSSLYTEQFRFRLRLTTDGSVVYDGVHVDDVAVFATTLCSITGTVTSSATGDPLPSIFVTAYRVAPDGGIDWVADTFSDYYGEYVLGGLTNGDYVVEFRDVFSGDYVLQYYDGKTSIDDADYVSLDTEGEIAGGVDAAMAVASHITGTVTDAATGDRLPSILVTAYRVTPEGLDFAANTFTDYYGEYFLGGLTAGDHVVEFRDVFNGDYGQQYFDGKTSAYDADYVTLETEGDFAGGIDAAMTMASRITGTVTDAATGNPLPGIGVSVYTETIDGWEGRGYTYTDYYGEYAVGGLMAGDYVVEFFDEAGQYVTECFDDKAGLYEADPVAVGGFETVYGIDAALASASCITGTLTSDAFGDPLPGVQATAYGETIDGWDWAGEGYTDYYGDYVIWGLTAGSYAVEFYDESGEYATEFFDDKAGIAVADPVVVGESSTASSVDAALATASHITGTVTSAAFGEPLPGIEVTVYMETIDGWAPWAYGNTDIYGDYDVGGLAAGEYLVGFVDWGGVYANQFYSGKTSKTDADALTLIENQTLLNIDGVLVAGSHITGTVTEAGSGDPLEDIIAQSYTLDGPEWRWESYAYTDASGYYDLGGLPAGTHYVAFFGWEYGRGLLQYYTGKSTWDTADPVVLGVGGTESGIDVVISLTPIIDSVSSSVGPALGGTEVTLTGVGFTGADSVTFGGIEAESFSVDSDTQITAIAPAHAAGTVQIKVSNGVTWSEDTAADDFTFLAVATYQQTDPHITYLGNWYTGWSASASGSSFAYTDIKGAAALIEFEGTSVALLGKTSSVYGKAEVWLDDAEDPVIIDFYSADTLYQQTVFTAEGLDNATHTLVIKCLHEKNEASGGYYVNLDAIKVVGSLSQAVAPTRSEQNAPEINQSGDFVGGWSALYSGGSFRYFDSPGCAVSVKFEGQYLAWIAKKSPVYGQAKVKLDDGPLIPVDLYNATTLYQQKVYDTGLLDPGVHTLTIYWTGEKNPAAGGTYVNTDAFEVLGTLLAAPAAEPIAYTFQQTDARITYLGGPWYTGWSTSASGGNFTYTETEGAGALIKFQGTSLALVGKTSPVYGQAEVTLDGGAPVLIDLYSETTLYQQTLWSAEGLDNTTHSLVVRCLHEKNLASGGYYVNLDALEIKGFPTATTGMITRSEQNAPEINQSGDFVGGWSALYSGGSFRYFDSPGCAVSVKFEGQYLAWIAKKSPVYGQAKVSLDDGPLVPVDLYSASTLYQQKVYDTGLLDPGVHTLTIYWTGEKNPASSGTYVNTDAFEVLGTLLAAPVAEPIAYTYQQTDARITYLGGPWYTGWSTSASGGNFTYTDTEGAMALIKFQGTSIALVGKTSPVYGQAEVSLDGGAPVIIDLYSETTLYQQKFVMGGLDDTTHTLVVRCLHEKNPASGGHYVNLDALEIMGAPVASTGMMTRYQQNDPLIDHLGIFYGGWSALYSGGSFRYFDSSTTVTVTFQGQQAAWIAKMSPVYGLAEVRLDGGDPIPVDLYNTTTLYQQKVYETGLLPEGEHTLTITWKNDKNPSSSGTYVNTDAFDVLGYLVVPSVPAG